MMKEQQRRNKIMKKDMIRDKNEARNEDKKN